MRFLQFAIDWYLKATIWLTSRRDLLSLISDEQVARARSEARLRDEICAKEQEIEFLTKLNQRHLAWIEAEIAVQATRKAIAEQAER